MGHHHEDDDELEDEHEHDRPRGFVSGVLLGGVVGVAAGLLLAPAAGQVTRQKLRERAKSARDQAMEAAEGARDQALQAAEDVRAKAEDIQNTGRELLEENKRRIVRTAEAVKQSAQEAWTSEDKHGEPNTGQPNASQGGSTYNLMGQAGSAQSNPGTPRSGEAPRTSHGPTGGSTTH
jgi:gas vesicle protein